jgi:hypothetical protein
MYENRNYIIFSTEELDKIDFSQVLETSAETVRRSVDRSKTFVKWNGDEPSCIALLNSKQGPFTHEEMITILSSNEWSAESIIA